MLFSVFFKGFAQTQSVTVAVLFGSVMIWCIIATPMVAIFSKTSRGGLGPQPIWGKCSNFSYSRQGLSMVSHSRKCGLGETVLN